VRWQVRVRKFVCGNPACPRQIVTARLLTVAAPWARCTTRRMECLCALGLALGGAAGTRLTLRLRLRASRDTLLRLVRRLPLPAVPPLSAIGVDDWAHCKRHRYAQHREIAIAIELAQDFCAIVRIRQPDRFDSWLERATVSTVAPLQRFTTGLRADYDAVKAGLTLDWSNGPVEGQINRLKMLKRSMFGRANSTF